MSLTNRWRRLAGAGITLGLFVAGLSLAPGAPGTPVAEAATGGGSIVYVKDNNIWLTDGDGSVHRQVTTGGTAAAPWQSPTQSDDGVVVAYRDGVIYRMNQRGEVFNTLVPPHLLDSIGNELDGRNLSSTAISPDGTKIAYSYFKLFNGQRRWVTGFTSSTQVTDPGQYDVSYYANPSWVTNSRVVLNSWYRNKTHLVDLGVRDIAWFDERFYANPAKELSDLEVSRDGDWTVGVRGDVGDQTIVVIRNEGDVQTSATPWTPVFGETKPCEFGVNDRNLTEPTIAPDASTVAWAEPSGIYRVSNMNCDSTSRLDILVAAGGSDPAWGKPAIGQTPDVPKPVKKHLTIKKGPRVVGKAKVGKVLKVQRGSWSPAPERFQVRWMRDGKAIARASKASYRLTKKDRGHRIAVRVTAIRAGWLTTTKQSAPIRVRR